MSNEEIVADYSPTDKDFTGYVRLVLPDYEDLMAALEDMSVDFDDEGNPVRSSSTAGSGAKILKQIRESIKEVKLKHKKSGYVIDTYKSLSVFGKPVINELVTLFTKGFEPGKNLKLL